MALTTKVSVDEIKGLAKKLDRRGYKRYKLLREYLFNYDFFTARFTKIQGDPFAPPSILEAYVDVRVTGLPNRMFSREYIVPLTDYVYRILYRELRRRSRKCGSGHSCYLGVPRPSPVIIPRSGVEYSGGGLIIRFYVGLPARGRRILGGELSDLLGRRVVEALSFLRRLGD